MIKILVADDHQLLIDGIKTALANIQDIVVAGEAYNGQEVIDQLDAGLSVDVLLLDINMPEMDGLQCTKLVSKQYPKVKILILTQYDEKRLVKQLVKHGASGYLLKDSGRDILEKAIRAVVRGEKYFCERLAIRLISQELDEEKGNPLFSKFSEREIEILRLIAEEYSTQQIADKLFLSYHTIESHRSRMISKAGVRNSAGLVRWANENGYLL
ncbi:MAG TPA: response regulator transcription factor [Bacteroidales bacterium]|nr:response regulator transcription factor [Bacteroidales bacterium]HPI85416.1 response regulator transcription factor [Bacteroidales bacterium]